MDRRTFLAGAATGVAAGLAGCGGVLGGDGPPENYDVGMSSSKFLPPSLEVPVGTTVIWANTGSRAHTVTAYEDEIPQDAAYFASGGFDGEDAARDAWLDETGGAIYSYETYEHTFEVPGAYTYFCVPHESGGMIGTITVVEE
jgi:plastocyanin